MHDRHLLVDDVVRPVSCIVRLLSLPTLDQLAAAHDPHPAERRELTVVELVDADGRSGFGECSALNRAGYTPEWARGAFDLLTTSAGRPGEDAPMATAALEMAELDLALQRAGQSLATRLHSASRITTGLVPETLAAGVVLPLASADVTAASALEWAQRGVERLKLKILPGHISDTVAAVHRVCPGVELHVDANGSCTAEQLNELVSLTAHGVTTIEQPFAVTDRTTSARLVRSTQALVLADESATDLDTIVDLIGDGAATGVVIKPSRLGGLRAALEVHDWCVEAGVAVAAGGMLESGLGRHALVGLASLPGFTVVGDLSPARRWLAEDPFVDVVLATGRITVPTGPGVAPPPDVELLELLTIERAEFDWLDRQ